MATRTLAKKMHKETGLFSSIEHARGALRRYRGQSGDSGRRLLRHRDACTENGDSRRNGHEGGVEPAAASVLLFDIETSPNLAYVWRTFKEYIAPEQMIEETKVICWSAKWLGDDHVMFDSIESDMPAGGCSIEQWVEQDDARVCSTIYDLFNQATMVIGHNGKAFDTATLNTRWLKLGFAPPQPYQIFDTLQTARKVFNFPSNKLDGIARYLGLGAKLEHEGFNLWIKCMAGDAEAWRKMEKYCVHDTLLLEDLYMKIRAWDKRHPNLALVAGQDTRRCIVCGSTAMHGVSKSAYTAASEFPAYRCENCGKVQRGRKRYKPTLDADGRMANAL